MSIPVFTAALFLRVKWGKNPSAYGLMKTKAKCDRAVPRSLIQPLTGTRGEPSKPHPMGNKAPVRPGQGQQMRGREGKRVRTGCTEKPTGKTQC